MGKSFTLCCDPSLMTGGRGKLPFQSATSICPSPSMFAMAPSRTRNALKSVSGVSPSVAIKASASSMDTPPGCPMPIRLPFMSDSTSTSFPSSVITCMAVGLTAIQLRIFPGAPPKAPVPL